MPRDTFLSCFHLTKTQAGRAFRSVQRELRAVGLMHGIPAESARSPSRDTGFPIALPRVTTGTARSICLRGATGFEAATASAMWCATSSAMQSRR